MFESDIKNNPYVDRLSLILGLLLTIQTQFFLYIEKSNSDPFVLVLCYITTVYYSFRIYTVTFFPYSIVFDRIGAYTADDSNFALLVIIAANAFIASGLFSCKLGSRGAIDASNYRPAQPKIPIVFLYIIAILSSLNVLAPIDGSSRIINLLLVFCAPINIFIVVATYVFIYRVKIKLFYKINLFIVALILILLQTLGGSRSSLLSYCNILFFLVIVINKNYKVKAINVIFISVLIPVIINILTIVFISTTMLRANLDGGANNYSTSQKFSKFVEIVQSDEVEDRKEEALNLLFARLGFFDFTSEIIAHKEIYEELFTPLSYVKSIADNLLTPGFDIFDYPKIGNGLSQIYRGGGRLSKSNIESYQSDQVSLIAEIFSFCGYWAFIFLFLLGRLFKILYSRSENIAPFNIGLRRIFLVIVFYSLLISFGFDWVLLEAVVFLVTIAIAKFFFREIKIN